MQFRAGWIRTTDFYYKCNKIDEAACEDYEAGNETAASAKRESQACYLLIDSRA